MSKYRVASKDSREFLTRERCYITELMNDPSLPSVSLARCRVTAGVTTELHSLSVAECYVIAEGHGDMEVDGERFEVGPGDAVTIPAGAAQRIRNSGETDLVFQCLCQPRFTPGAYTPLEPD